MRLFQPQPFIINYATEELYYPDQCHGPDPQMCRPGVKYDKKQQSCLHGLVHNDKEQQHTCPVTYYNTQPPQQQIISDK